MALLNKNQIHFSKDLSIKKYVKGLHQFYLKQKLKEGDLVLGTLIVSTSPFWPKILKDCSLDFIFIDTEHIAISRETLSWMCRTYSAMGLPPLVRMKSPDQYIATETPVRR